MPLDSELLKIIACPKCHGDLTLGKEDSELSCQKCRLVYPIENNIPVLLVDQARPLS